MNCDDVQALLSAYADNELGAGEARELRAHLDACEACRRVLADYAAVDEMLATTPTITAAADFNERIRARLHESATKVRPVSRTVMLLALAATVVVALAAGLFLRTGPTPTVEPPDTMVSELPNFDLLADASYPGTWYQDVDDVFPGSVDVELPVFEVSLNGEGGLS